MTVFRVVAHSFVLMAANCVGLIVGFMVYAALRPVNQIVVQLPIAVLFSVLVFLAWVLLLRNLPFPQLCLQRNPELAWTFVVSLLWLPAVFVPVHYVTQGYLTSAGNIISGLMFQIPVNTIACLVAWKITQPKDRQLSSEAAPCASPDEVSS